MTTNNPQDLGSAELIQLISTKWETLKGFISQSFRYDRSTRRAKLIGGTVDEAQLAMALQLSPEEMIQRVRASGLVHVGDFDAVMNELRASGVRPTLRELLDRLVADKYLTPFQADRLAVGKYKGFRLGSYVILDRLGSGGMGQVFLSEHGSLRRRAAIKVLPIPVAEDDVARERFHREARAAAALDHPNIVRVFDLNQEGQLLYLVMEYIDGIDLQTLVTKGGKLSVAAAASYAIQAAIGLDHAHEKGLIHRDVKPGNILVDRIGVARILDLGLVRTAESEDSRLTQRIGGKGVLGTVDYLAPEQAVDSSSVDRRADIYSLGATLYFLLAGHTMFPDGRAAQKLMWQQTKDPTPIRQLRPDIPEELAAIVHKALAKNPAARFPSMIEMAEALAPFADEAAPPNPAFLRTPPIWRGLGRPTDTGSAVRLGGGGPSSGRITSSQSGRLYAKSQTPRPASTGGPKSSNLMSRTERPVPTELETTNGMSDRTNDSVTSMPDSPEASTGESSILSAAEARALGVLGSSSNALSPLSSVPSLGRPGVPLPIVLFLVVVAAAVTGGIVWLIANH